MPQTHLLVTPPDRVRVIGLGETMLMFAPPAHGLLEHSTTFEAYIGGAEANVAIGVERLGIHGGWIGKLPDNPLGHNLVNGIRACGVDTSAVVWSAEGRVGTFFVEWGAKPRPTKTLYDRANSAATTLTADELDWDYIGRAEWLHLSGISPALSVTCRQSTLDIARRARALGVKVSFDLNYRALLWSPQEARAAWSEILPSTDLIVATEPDATLLLGEELPPEKAVRRLWEIFGPSAAVLTCGGQGCVACDGSQLWTGESYYPEVVNRLGAGDAFVAGFLYGLMEADLQTALAYGCAMAALKFTIPQNIPLILKEDVERLVQGKSVHLVR